MSKKARNLKREYAKFGGTAKAKKDRAKTNAARKKAGLKKGDPREVDHKTPLARGGSNAKKNLRVVSRKVNRRKGKR